MTAMNNAYQRFACLGMHYHRPRKSLVCAIYFTIRLGAVYGHIDMVVRVPEVNVVRRISLRFDCILLYTFNAYRDINEIHLVDNNSYSFCEHLFDQLYTNALTLSELYFSH